MPVHLRPLKLVGRPVDRFDPKRVVVSDLVTEDEVVIRMEVPDGDEVWVEITLSEARLRVYLARIEAAKQSPTEPESAPTPP